MIYFGALFFFFVGLAVALIIFMLAYLVIQKKRRSKYHKWNNMIDLLLRKTIFFEEDSKLEDNLIPITSRFRKQMSISRFRDHLCERIIGASKDILGQSSLNLQKLYLQLNLDHYALKKISNRKWDIRAKGIQQIGIMGLKEHLTKIYRYTNDKNELVRIEAQTAVLKLFGFEGLRFLDVISYQISEWQQIKLLKELSNLSHVDLKGIDKWLNSDNSSVVSFALKLARNYHHFELYNEIEACLKHQSVDVRLQAIYTLTDVFTEETSSKLLDVFDSETIENQLSIAKALMKIGDEDDVPRLMQYLDTTNFELKLSIARTIANLSSSGLNLLEDDPQAKEYPLNEMIMQIKSELKR